MSIKRSALLLILGTLLGVALTAGVLAGLGRYSPEFLRRFAVNIAQVPASPAPSNSHGSVTDSSAVRKLVQDILSSDQGKAIVDDIIKNQSGDMLHSMLKEAVKSPEFRKTLSEVLESFFNSPEGKDLIKKIVRDLQTP